MEEASELLARRMAGQASEEEVEAFRQRFLKDVGGLALRSWLVIAVLLTVVYGLSLGPARLLAWAERWQPLVEVVVNIFLGLAAIYLANRANRISHQQTELTRRRTDVADRQQRLAEEQLRPRLRVRLRVDRYPEPIGLVSSYSIENLGGEVTDVFVMTASALEVRLRRSAVDTEFESFAVPVGFFTQPRYTQEVKGTVFENRALSYKNSKWISNTSALLGAGEILNQRLKERGGSCLLSLKHFAFVRALGAFGGVDEAVFEIPLNDDSVFPSGGVVRLPFQEGNEVVSAINRWFFGWSVADAVEFISKTKVEGGELNATMAVTISEVGKALEALKRRQEADLQKTAEEVSGGRNAG